MAYMQLSRRTHRFHHLRTCTRRPSITHSCMKMAALIPSTSPFLLGVYRVTLSVEVRRKPDFSEHSRSGTTLQVGAIVSTIQKVRVRGVDFVRLEDNSGWVFTTSKAKNVVLKPEKHQYL